MNPSNQTTVTPREIAAILQRKWKLWVIPTAAFTLLALLYALVRTPDWNASQALLVRDEAGSSDARQGRFEDIESMKTAQETIQEIARNESVVAAALAEVGPPADHDPEDPWPTQRDTQRALASISVTPPNGAEFGKTEVLYLNVKNKDRRRAIALATAVCNQIDRRLAQLRDHRAASVVAELERAIALIRVDHAEATERLEAIERNVGSDLGELRTLNGGGGGSLRASLNEIKNELRDHRADQRADQQQLDILTAAQHEPDALIATPNALLKSQPALGRLKEGLVDSQLATSRLLAKMSEDHPHVQAAAAAENLIRHQLHDELEIAIRGLKSDIRVRTALIGSREEQLADVTARLDNLAGMRARYNNLLEQKHHQAEVLDRAQKNLAEARASQTGARSASLIARLDGPVTGDLPLGPGKKIIALGGFAGGLTFGLGLVFLSTPMGQRQGRRFSDMLGHLPGRRKTDGVRGRREGGQTETNPTAGQRRREDDDAGRGRRAEDDARGRPSEDPTRERRASDVETPTPMGAQ